MLAEPFVGWGITIIVTVLITEVKTFTLASTSCVPQCHLVTLGIILRAVLAALLADPVVSEVNIVASVKGDNGSLACQELRTFINRIRSAHTRGIPTLQD